MCLDCLISSVLLYLSFFDFLLNTIIKLFNFKLGKRIINCAAKLRPKHRGNGKGQL